MLDAFNYVYNNQGIDSEASYPYTGQRADQCNYNLDYNVESQLTGFTFVNGEDDLKVAIATIGPVLIKIKFSVR